MFLRWFGERWRVLEFRPSRQSDSGGMEGEDEDGLCAGVGSVDQLVMLGDDELSCFSMSDFGSNRPKQGV